MASDEFNKKLKDGASEAIDQLVRLMKDDNESISLAACQEILRLAEKNAV